MDYVKKRTHIINHPRFLEAGALARDLYDWGMLYAGQLETDGEIATVAVLTSPWGAGGKKNAAVAERLVEVGLWERTPTGFRILRWTEQGNVTKAQLEADRKAARERMKRRRGGDDGAPPGAPPPPPPSPPPSRSGDVRANIGRTSPDVPSSPFTSSCDSGPEGGAGGTDEPRSKRPLSLRRFEEGFLGAAFAAGVSTVTGAAYAVPDDERRALDDLVDAHCPTHGGARDVWLRDVARRFREAIRGREKFHRFGGPRGCLDWVNAGSPSADELAKSAEDLRADHLEARRKTKALAALRRTDAAHAEAEAEAMPLEQLRSGVGDLLRAVGGGR